MADPERASDSLFTARLQELFERHAKSGAQGHAYTVAEVARSVGLSESYLNYLLRGERDNPSWLIIQRLANFFQVRPGYFFEQAEKSEGGDVDVDPDLEQITVLARAMPAGPSRAGLRAIVEQVAALEAQGKAGRRRRPDKA